MLPQRAKLVFFGRRFGSLQQRGLVVVKMESPSFRLHFCRKRIYLGGALRFSALHAEFAGRGIDTGFSAMTPAICSLALKRRKLRRLTLWIFREPDPFGDMLCTFKRGQFRAIQVFRDFPHARINSTAAFFANGDFCKTKLDAGFKPMTPRDEFPAILFTEEASERAAQRRRAPAVPRRLAPSSRRTYIPLHGRREPYRRRAGGHHQIAARDDRDRSLPIVAAHPPSQINFGEARPGIGARARETRHSDASAAVEAQHARREEKTGAALILALGPQMASDAASHVAMGALAVWLACRLPGLR